MKETTNSHIAGLDLIRLAAAILVVFDHFTAEWGRNKGLAAAIGEGLPSFPALSPVTNAGGIGVDIFFVISGLVIAGSANGKSPRRFAKGRFFRLMPSVWIASTLSAIVLVFATNIEWREIFATYLRSLVLSPKGPWVDGSYWTLCVEVTFYVLIFAILCKNKFSEIDKILGVVGVAVSVLAVAALMLLPRSAVLFALLASWPAKLLLLHNGAEFVFGVFLYLILFIGPNLFRCSILAICGLGCCAKIISWVVFHHGSVVGSSFVAWLPLILWLAAVSAMILSVRFNGLILSRFEPAMPAVRQMGLLTYPLYLIHSPLGLVVMQQAYRFTHSSTVALIMAVVVVLSAAVAILLIEPMLRSWIKWPVWRAADFAQRRFFTARMAEPTSRFE
jgi:peptidoglycan/LPS O-acetylase OafA/YrhL